MFVEALKRQNPALISAALSLWQQGKIAPDSWVIDVDQILENGKRLIETARLYGIELYLMTKQFGRNPWLAEKLLALGYSGIVAVDYKEARVMRRAGLPVAHQGHLVQIPCHQVADAVEQGTDVITVFTLDKAREVSAAAVKAGRIQSVLLKVYSDDDFLYPGQESGFALKVLPEIVAEIQNLPGLHLAGLTHFPCLLWDEAVGKVLPTPNLHTLIQARDQLAKSGIALEQLNAPSATSCTSLPLLAQYGVTHAEPGHALTGTIPANQQGDQPERIAMLWLSEISHHFRGDSYCYGGGYYRRGHAQHALVFTPENQKITETNLKTVDDSSIDYTLPLAEGVGAVVGDADVINRIRATLYSGGSQIQGAQALEVLRGLVFAPVMHAVQAGVSERLLALLNGGAVPEVKSAVIANAQSKVLIVEFHQPIAARVLEEAQKRGALPYPVGAESKYEIPPLFYRLSGTFRQANPQSEHCAIRINPNRSGEDTVLRILRESIASI
ncbi:YhfX family PLP-dependent enzyme [Escherichia coli]